MSEPRIEEWPRCAADTCGMRLLPVEVERGMRHCMDCEKLYQAGIEEGERRERAAIVAWLKTVANYSPELKRRYHSDDYAMGIERGDHLRGDEGDKTK